ncbi:MAG: hypothetical protein LBC92_00270 [Rickettsiales bacterium]|jgi:hypothetical protein|nr:hypothetical protein [Rickettsiales bacterium]
MENNQSDLDRGYIPSVAYENLLALLNKNILSSSDKCLTVREVESYIQCWKNEGGNKVASILPSVALKLNILVNKNEGSSRKNNKELLKYYQDLKKKQEMKQFLDGGGLNINKIVGYENSIKKNIVDAIKAKNGTPITSLQEYNNARKNIISELIGENSEYEGLIEVDDDGVILFVDTCNKDINNNITINFDVNRVKRYNALMFKLNNRFNNRFKVDCSRDENMRSALSFITSKEEAFLPILLSDESLKETIQIQNELKQQKKNVTPRIKEIIDSGATEDEITNQIAVYAYRETLSGKFGSHVSSINLRELLQRKGGERSSTTIILGLSNKEQIDRGNKVIEKIEYIFDNQCEIDPNTNTNPIRISENKRKAVEVIKKTLSRIDERQIQQTLI